MSCCISHLCSAGEPLRGYLWGLRAIQQYLGFFIAACNNVLYRDPGAADACRHNIIIYIYIYIYIHIYMLWRYVIVVLAIGAATRSQVLRDNYVQCTRGQGLCIGQSKKQQDLRGQVAIA
jgi:hypothetical protein